SQHLGPRSFREVEALAELERTERAAVAVHRAAELDDPRPGVVRSVAVEVEVAAAGWQRRRQVQLERQPIDGPNGLDAGGEGAGGVDDEDVAPPEMIREVSERRMR